MKATTKNTLTAVVIAAALCIHATFDNSGWPLVGNIFGYLLLVGGVWMVINAELKERDNDGV